MKWEYKNFRFTYKYGNTSSIEEKFTSIGAEGWEIFSMSFDHFYDSESALYNSANVWAKRLIKETE